LHRHAKPDVFAIIIGYGVGSIHPPGPRVGTGGLTCVSPSDPQTSQRTRIGKRLSPRPSDISAPRLICDHRWQFAQ
jgi:hypothetical protein